MEHHSTDKNGFTLQLGPEEAGVFSNILPEGFVPERGFGVVVDPNRSIDGKLLARYIRRLNECQFFFLKVDMKVYFNLPNAGSSTKMGFGIIQALNKEKGHCVVRCYRPIALPNPSNGKSHIIIADWTTPLPDLEYIEPCALREWTGITCGFDTELDRSPGNNERAVIIERHPKRSDGEAAPKKRTKTSSSSSSSS